MKTLLTLGFLVSVLSSAHAITPPFTNTGATVLAQVNMTDATIQKTARTNYYTVSFTVTTRDPEQSGLLYKVTLAEKTSRDSNSTQYTYTSTLPFSVNERKPYTVADTFAVPKDLQGTFTGTVSVYNKKGLLLATNTVNNIVLTSQGQASFDIESCALDKKIYDTDMDMKGSCVVAGTPAPGDVISLTLRYGNELGSLVGIPLTAKKGTVSFTLPKQTRAGVYMLTAQAFSGKSPVGGSIVIPVVVNGTTANLLSIMTDKTFYQEGDVANVTLGLNLFAKEAVKMFAKVTITGATKQDVCGGPVTVPVSKLGSVSLIVPITETCNGYTVSATLLQDKNVVLDSHSLLVHGEEAPQVVGYVTRFLLIGAVIILLSSLIRRRTK